MIDFKENEKLAEELVQGLEKWYDILVKMRLDRQLEFGEYHIHHRRMTHELGELFMRVTESFKSINFSKRNRTFLLGMSSEDDAHAIANLVMSKSKIFDDCWVLEIQPECTLFIAEKYPWKESQYSKILY